MMTLWPYGMRQGQVRSTQRFRKWWTDIAGSCPISISSDGSKHSFRQRNQWAGLGFANRGQALGTFVKEFALDGRLYKPSIHGTPRGRVHMPSLSVRQARPRPRAANSHPKHSHVMVIPTARQLTRIRSKKDAVACANSLKPY
jgi:hypothetical protein